MSVMAEISKILASNLKKFRNELHLTQAQLAETAGISVISIQHYESQRVWPSFEVVSDLSRALGIEDYKLFEKSPAPPIEVLADHIVKQEHELKDLRFLVGQTPRDILEALSKASARKLDMVRAVLGLPVAVASRKSQPKKA